MFYMSLALHNIIENIFKPYMLTPCNHVFHYECLEKWLEYKKECPNCRKSMEGYLQ